MYCRSQAEGSRPRSRPAGQHDIRISKRQHSRHRQARGVHQHRRREVRGRQKQNRLQDPHMPPRLDRKWHLDGLVEAVRVHLRVHDVHDHREPGERRLQGEEAHRALLVQHDRGGRGMDSEEQAREVRGAHLVLEGVALQQQSRRDEETPNVAGLEGPHKVQRISSPLRKARVVQRVPQQACVIAACKVGAPDAASAARPEEQAHREGEDGRRPAPEDLHQRHRRPIRRAE
mmetsp:Transcript_23102/g.66986  ORF Transcript_23102/g.66986 Transcript_23102/m.66986 type:complete len:231 (-) Transcript_23102:21-713(-)